MENSSILFELHSLYPDIHYEAYVFPKKYQGLFILKTQNCLLLNF